MEVSSSPTINYIPIHIKTEHVDDNIEDPIHANFELFSEGISDDFRIKTEETKAENITDEELVRYCQIKTNDVDVKDDFSTKFDISESEEQYKDDVDSIRAVLQCDICRQIIRSPEELMQHRFQHTFDPFFTCLICCKPYETKQSLKIHFKGYHGSNIIQCDICLKTFISPVYYNKHRLVHAGEGPFQCDVCRQRFTKRSSLLWHKRSDKALANSVECVICHAIFRFRKALRRHMRIHSGQKPFECQTCSCRFSQSCMLMKHMRMHTGNKPHKCEVCYDCFTDYSSLKYHESKHTAHLFLPIECSMCQKQFCSASDLNEHMLSHAPLKCRACNRTYQKIVHLNRHERVAHAAVKQFPCKVCNKSFDRELYMHNHMLKQHPQFWAECTRCLKMMFDRKPNALDSRPEERQECELCSKCGIIPSDRPAVRKTYSKRNLPCKLKEEDISNTIVKSD